MRRIMCEFHTAQSNLTNKEKYYLSFVVKKSVRIGYAYSSTAYERQQLS